MIVTGTQRSGTMSYASLLGIPHEHYFNYNNSKSKEPISEVSWLAAPHTKELLKAGYKVIRLVRHPMSVINSLMGIRFWTGIGHKLYRDYIDKYIEISKILEEPTKTELYLHLSAQYYIKWHNLIPDTVPVVRIEDLINGPHLNSRQQAEYSIDDLNINDIEQLEELIKPWSYTMERELSNV